MAHGSARLLARREAGANTSVATVRDAGHPGDVGAKPLRRRSLDERGWGPEPTSLEPGRKAADMELAITRSLHQCHGDRRRAGERVVGDDTRKPPEGQVPLTPDEHSISPPDDNDPPFGVEQDCP